MKFRQYISQSWQIIKQNRLYSGFYTLGTALAISMVMVLAIGYNLKIGNIYPEVNRDRIMVLSTFHENYGGLISTSPFSEELIEKLLSGVDGIEAVCIYIAGGSKQLDTQKDILSEIKKREVSYYNEGLWEVHQFDFVDGRPFTKEDVANSSLQAVISNATAKSFFGDESAVGKKILVDYKEFTVCGVVKDVSPLVYMSSADIYLPHTLIISPPYVSNAITFMGGNLSAQILAKSPEDFDKIKSQIEGNLAKIESTLDDGVKISLLGGPNSFIEDSLSVISDYEGRSNAASQHILQLILIVLVIILIPTFNLSGIISTEMEDREAEVGIRKAFGASRGKLLYNLINENLLLSFIGGVIGLLLSYLFIYLGYQLFIDLLQLPSSAYSALHVGFFINYKVIIIVIVSCLVMNLLSSIIPQYFATKKNIITLLNRNNSVSEGNSIKLKNAWIFLELLAVFVVTWMAIDPLYVLNYQKSIYDGFDHKDLYVVSIPSISYKSPAYREETADGIAQYSKMVLDIIKNHPLVDNAVRGYSMPMNASHFMYTTLVSNLDTSKIATHMLYIPADKNCFSVHGIKELEELDLEDLNGMMISKSIAKHFFGDDDAIGKKLWHNSVDGYGVRIIGVFDDVKNEQYKQPIPTVITFEIDYRGSLDYSGNIHLFVKLKPGVLEGEFIKAFTEDLGDKFKIGNRYFGEVSPYYKGIERKSEHIAITKEKNIYTMLTCFVLFNMFLGIFATFWLKSKKRRSEIGLRMAMGSSKKGVRKMFVMESVKMASLASLVGMIVVSNIVYFRGMFTFGEWQSPTYWPITNDIAHFLIVSLMAYAVILLIVILGTLIPASKAANTNPVDALRDE